MLIDTGMLVNTYSFLFLLSKNINI
jgi:hypothetical protein